MNTTTFSKPEASLSVPQARRIGRSIGAVVAGASTLAMASHGADAAMRALGVFPEWGVVMSNGAFALAVAYRAAFGVLGSYVTARLAPARAMKHALVLGAIGTALSILSLLATWNRGPEFGPKWYPLLLAATALPCAWLGCQLRLRTGVDAAN